MLVYALRVRALGIDYGRKRIGLALSDATGMLARPWKTIGAPAAPSGAASVTQLRAQRTVALSELEALENSAKVA